MVYITSIPRTKPNIYTHQYSEGGLSTPTQNGNINPTACDSGFLGKAGFGLQLLIVLGGSGDLVRLLKGLLKGIYRVP